MKRGLVIEKKGLSTLVTSLILILLVLVAVGILYSVYINFIKEGVGDVSVGKFTINLEIQSVKINEDGTVDVNVKRNVGDGALTGIKFVVSDGVKTEVFDESTTMQELGSNIFKLDYISEDGLIEKISIAPIVTTSSGKESVGNEVDKKENVMEPTINIVTNTDLSATSWSKNYNADISYNYDGPEGTNAIVANFKDANSDGSSYWFSYGDFAPQEDGTIYTISLWVKTEDSISIHAYTCDNSETGRKSTGYINVNPSDGWKRVVLNPITTNNPNDCDSLSFQWGGLAEGKYMSISAPQMEAKSHSTPFVVGTRD